VAALRRLCQRARPIAWAAAACVALVPDHDSVRAERLGFEDAQGLAGWDVDADASAFSIDDSIARSGGRSLRVDVRGNSVRFSRHLTPGDLAGNRLRISAWVRTTVSAGLWVRISGPAGLLYVDRVSSAGNDDGAYVDRASSAAAADGAWSEVTLEAPVSTLAERVEVGANVSGDGIAWFDDVSLETLDAAELPPPAAAAARYVEEALALLAEHSLEYGELDWPALVARVRLQTRGARDVEGAYLAVRYALGELGDGHSYFMTPAQMRRLETAPVSNARTGRPSVAPRGMPIAPGIGYLQVPGFAGGEHRAQAAFAADLQSRIAALAADGACGFVVDLRANSGGNLWPMLVGLGPLLGDGEVGAAVYPDATRRTFWYRDGKAGLDDFVQLRVNTPLTLEHAPVPVAVLTGRATASAAEVLAAAFRALPRTRSFGAPTRGVHTSTRVFPLADGAAIVLAVAATSNRNGETFVGPIAPDEPISATRRGGTTLAEDAAVTAAVDWLSASGGCARADLAGGFASAAR